MDSLPQDTMCTRDAVVQYRNSQLFPLCGEGEGEGEGKGEGD